LTRVIRGLYGPLPTDVLNPVSRRRSLRSLWAAALVGRHFVRLRSVSPAEQELVSAAASEARFPAWMPAMVPAGFAIVRADLVPYSRDVLTLRLSQGAREFEAAQRRRWLPLDEELTTAGLPFDRVPISPAPLYLVHGKHGGEPIDMSFWSTRRALVFEVGDIRVELREVVGRGPGLAALIRFAENAARALRAVDIKA